jgi:hypothetical protein
MFSQVISQISWLHVLVAALAYFALGSIWYSPVLFSKAWIKALGIDINSADAKKGIAGMFIGSFICMFVIATGIAIMHTVLPAINAIGGLKLGIFIGICFSSTTATINYLYQKKPMALYLIDCGYQVVGAAIAGAIIAGWH